MRILLARTAAGWLQRVDTRRAKPMPDNANPIAYANSVTKEFDRWRDKFVPSVATQFGLDPAAITPVEREMEGWVDDAPYEALVAQLATGMFEGQPVTAAPKAPPRKRDVAMAKIDDIINDKKTATSLRDALAAIKDAFGG